MTRWLVSSLAVAALASPTLSRAADRQLPPPPNARVEAISSGSVLLRWDGARAGDVVYRVYANGRTVGVTSNLTFTDTGLRPGAEYCYEVVAVDAVGRESARNAAVCAAVGTSPARPPPEPREPPAPASEPPSDDDPALPPARERSALS